MRHALQAGQPKLSREFASRLAAPDPAATVQALVRLATGSRATLRGSCPLGQERKAALAVIRSQADSSLSEVDGILARCGGRRLDAAADALGFVLVEATACALEALANSDRVATILEIQAASPPTPARR